jgi:amino acid transporter
MFPRAGGEYDYVKNAFNAHAAFVTGWLVFLSGILAATTMPRPVSSSGWPHPRR